MSIASALGGALFEAPSADADSSTRTVTDPFQGEAAVVPEGRSLFNQYCSHCHAPNAMNPDASKDLRRLQSRYGEQMAEVFHNTVTHGRPDKGMPNWGGVLDDETLWKIFTFLQSVQTKS